MLLDIHEFSLTAGAAGFALDVTALEDARKDLKRHIQAHASTLDKLSTAIAIFGPISVSCSLTPLRRALGPRC